MKEESHLTKEEQEIFDQAVRIKEMMDTKGYKDFSEFLVRKLYESFPDPAQFKEDKEFMYAALCSSVFKKVVNEILGYFKQAEFNFEDLLAKRDGLVETRAGSFNDELSKGGE